MANTFNKERHEYLIDGKRATGVTTIIGVLAKPALINWAAKEAANYFLAAVNKLASAPISTEILEGIHEQAIVAHNKKKEAAGTHGTDAHALVELYVNECISKYNGEPYEHVEISPIKPFVDWAVANVGTFLFAERQMFDAALFIAGTADFGCILKTGQKLIGDFKTSSGVYGIDYFLQCAGYKLLAESEGDKGYDGCVIVRLGKKGPKDFDVTYSYDTVTAETAFLACLTIYRAQATLQS